MAAGTDELQDVEAVEDRGLSYEIGQGTNIVGMDMAGALHPQRAGLESRTESCHERVEQGF